MNTTKPVGNWSYGQQLSYQLYSKWHTNPKFWLIKHLKSPFSCGFPIVFPWFSHGFPMIFPWFSQGFPMIFPWFSYVSSAHGIPGLPGKWTTRQLGVSGASPVLCFTNKLGISMGICNIFHRIHVWYIYICEHDWGILMGSMLPYIAYMDPMGIYIY